VPFRRRLVRGYECVTTAARAAGAFGATLSGSGSSILAVAAVPDATRRLRTGQRVRVDGGTGTVQVLDEEGAAPSGVDR